MSYSRKDSGLVFTQIRPESHQQDENGDLLLLSVEASYFPKTLVINIYNAPPGATNPGAGLSCLLSLPETQIFPQTLVAGDFNLHHDLWHPSFSGSPSPGTGDFIRWLELRGLNLASQIDVPTHNRGNVLDLCFATDSLFAKEISASIQADLDVTSDHLPLLILLPEVNRIPPPTRLRFSTMDQKTFLALLSMDLEGLSPLVKSKPGLDYMAAELIRILHSSFSGSAKKSLPTNKGQAWWNQSVRNRLTRV
ncbi:hypothetical protein K3495_g16350 [Podosphaera aphanis]|nr:hypothetical protein K3495_g16350 [Podosphaera aphanis]